MFNNLLSGIPLFASTRRRQSAGQVALARTDRTQRVDKRLTGAPTRAWSGHLMRFYGGSAAGQAKDACMQNIIAESKTYLAESRAAQWDGARRTSDVSSAMVATVSQCFTIIQSCAEELNHALGQSELWVSCTAPAFVSESMSYNRRREATQTLTTFRARISSSKLSIVIKGKDDKVEFFLLPAQKVVGLSFAERDYNPLMSFVAARQEGEIRWRVEGKPLTQERLERYIVELFKFFVDETRTYQ